MKIVTKCNDNCIHHDFTPRIRVRKAYLCELVKQNLTLKRDDTD